MTAAGCLAILAAIARYAHAWDDRDPEAHAASFTADAVFESQISGPGGAPQIRHEGRPAILAWARERAAALSDKRSRHTPGSTVFDELSPNVAAARPAIPSAPSRSSPRRESGRINALRTPPRPDRRR